VPDRSFEFQRIQEMWVIFVAVLFFCLTLCAITIPVMLYDADLSVDMRVFYVLTLPSLGVLNGLAVGAIYYMPMRTMFYAIEGALQRVLRTRSEFRARATRPLGDTLGRPVRQSHLVDTEGRRGRVDRDLASLRTTVVLPDVAALCDDARRLVQDAVTAAEQDSGSPLAASASGSPRHHTGVSIDHATPHRGAPNRAYVRSRTKHAPDSFGLSAGTSGAHDGSDLDAPQTLSPDNLADTPSAMTDA
jgi:hypothetical protein